MDDERFRREIADLKAKEKKLRKATGQSEVPEEGSTNPSPALRYTWLGLEFAAIFFGFVWGGRWLDDHLGTKPWLVLAGIGAGFSIALYRLIFVAKRLGREDEKA